MQYLKNTSLISIFLLSFSCLFLVLDAQNGDPEELVARKVIESFSNFDDLQTKETEKYFINVRQLDDGNKEVQICMKETGRQNMHTYYFVVHGDDFSYKKVLPSQTGFPKD